MKGIVAELEADVLKLEQALVLLDDRVLRAGQNLDQSDLVEVFEYTHNRQAPYKFRNQPKFDEVFRLNVTYHFKIAFALDRDFCGWLLLFRLETERLLAGAATNNLIQTYKCAAANEENVGSVHGSEFLVGMLASTLRRNVGDSTFEDLEQRLLHAFTGNVAGNGGVLILTSDFVNFIYVDDSGLGAAHISVSSLKQLQDNVFNIFTDVPGFGQRGCIDDSEGNVQHARQRLRH